MLLSYRPFARKFKQNDPVLNRIDRELLRRRRDGFAYGGWCLKDGKGNNDSCSSELEIESFGVLRPGSGSRRLKTLMAKLMSAQNFSKRQCAS